MMGEEPVEKNIGSEIAVEDGRCNGVQYTHDLCLQVELRWARSRKGVAKLPIPVTFWVTNALHNT